MPKRNNISEQRAKLLADPTALQGIPKTGKYLKICVYCRKPYYSDARGQRFCCPDCQRKYQARRTKNRKRYDSIAPFERIRVRSHEVATNTLLALESINIVKHECAHCHAKGGDRGVILECHHKDLNFLNNTPSNLQWLCHKCHKLEHSRIEKQAAADGITMEEFYDESLRPITNIINSTKDLE